MMELYIRTPTGRYTTADNLYICEAASEIILNNQMRGAALTTPQDTREFLRTRLVLREAECFCVIHLDNQHRVIAFEEMFQGTIDGASVHPREVVKSALKHNSAALILAHNHPSGVAEPSQADKDITKRLRDSLALVDIRVLDHFIVGDPEVTSFAERGYL
jgi:DNA repair protein RadC